MFDWTERDKLDEVERYPLRAGDFPIRGRSAWLRLWEQLLSLARNAYEDPDEQAPWDEALQGLPRGGGERSTPTRGPSPVLHLRVPSPRRCRLR